MESLTPLVQQPGSLKSPVLSPGSTIGIVAPAGPIPPEALASGLERIHSWGYRTVVGRHVLDRRGYLAGADIDRAADFNDVWSNPRVDGVLCARGGYGVMRMLPLVDWAMIRQNPKFFCGFSDITALHVALERETGLVTFHGPMAAAHGAALLYNEAGLRRALDSRSPLGLIPWPIPEGMDPTPADPLAGEPFPRPLTICPGVAEGRLIGGNLTLLTALMGTPWEPDFTGRVVLIEEIDEAPYRVDRMLMQLLLGRKLQGAAGIVFGDSPSCLFAPEGRPSLSLPEVLEDLLSPLSIPVLYGFPCGHTAYRATIPLGVPARLDAGRGTLTILEAAFK